MSQNDGRWPYEPGGRFQIPNPSGQIGGPYDQDSRLFQDLIQRDVRPVRVFRLDLGVAGQLSINEPGFHFVQYGFQQESPGVDGNKPVNTTTLVRVQINTEHDNGSDFFPAKHARGYSGPFKGLFLVWDAQTSNGEHIFCDFIVFKAFERPWIDGESCT